jgi:hypothetical protein
VRQDRSPHWKKRENKGHRHFTVNAYIQVIAEAERFDTCSDLCPDADVHKEQSLYNELQVQKT